MKSVTGLILTLLLASGLPIAAEETCVEAFKKNNKTYLEERSRIEKKLWGSHGGAVVGGVTGTALVISGRTIPGLVVGGAVVGLAELSAHGYAKQMSELYDSHRLYKSYTAYTRKLNERPDTVQDLMTDLGVKFDDNVEPNVRREKEDAVLKALATLIEWGGLCEGVKPRSYEEAKELLKSRMTAPN